MSGRLATPRRCACSRGLDAAAVLVDGRQARQHEWLDLLRGSRPALLPQLRHGAAQTETRAAAGHQVRARRRGGREGLQGVTSVTSGPQTRLVRGCLGVRDQSRLGPIEERRHHYWMTPRGGSNFLHRLQRIGGMRLHWTLAVL